MSATDGGVGDSSVNCRPSVATAGVSANCRPAVSTAGVGVGVPFGLAPAAAFEVGFDDGEADAGLAVEADSFGGEAIARVSVEAGSKR